MREHGITLRLGEEVAEVRRETTDRIVAETRSGKAVVGEKLLYAVGREGNTADLALERAGLRAGRRGLIEVNAQFQTAVAHVYAVGDVIGFRGPIDYFVDTVFNYPTLSEAYKVAALNGLNRL